MALSFPLTNIDIDILDWPGKGNKRFINFPIEDDLAPFEDINNNGIYDPEYGDYPKIKGDESQFVVFNDVSMGRIDTPNKAIGVEVQLMTSIFYSQVENGLGTSLFHDCRIIKKTAGNVRDFILSLYQDGDLGNFSDDYLGCDTLSNTGFMYNADEYDEPAASVANYGYNPPILFTSFINKKMGAFSFFINGSGGPLNDPVKDKNFRYLMEGLSTIGTPYTIGFIPGNPITKHLYFGNPSDSTQWSMQSTAQTPRDIRMLMSSEKTMLEYNKPIDYNFVTYVHKFKGTSFKPNITDSVLPDLNKVKSKYKDSLDCNIQFNFTITPDTNNLKKGKIELSSFTNIKPPYTINWSSLETTDNIKNKDSGWYRVIIKDANHCIKVSQFKIPKIYKNSAGIDANHIESVSVYPIPFQNQISITNPERLKINKIVLFDIVGKQVKEFNLYNKNTKLELQVNELPQGNYILSIQSDSGEKNFKISK